MLSGAACASISSAIPATSAGVSPFMCMAMPNPAIWAGVAAPSMISFIAQAAASPESDSPLINWPIRPGHDALSSIAGPLEV